MQHLKVSCLVDEFQQQKRGKHTKEERLQQLVHAAEKHLADETWHP